MGEGLGLWGERGSGFGEEGERSGAMEEWSRELEGMNGRELEE